MTRVGLAEEKLSEIQCLLSLETRIKAAEERE